MAISVVSVHFHPPATFSNLSEPVNALEQHGKGIGARHQGAGVDVDRLHRKVARRHRFAIDALTIFTGAMALSFS